MDLLGTTFQNPILLAAGTAGYGRELARTIRLDSLGGLVTKAVSLMPRAGNRAPRVAEFSGGMLNSIGLANPGVAVVGESELPWLAEHVRLARIIVNVVGFAEEEYAAVIERLDSAPNIAAYEINLSCPNTSAGGIEFGADAGSVGRIMAGCRSKTRRPILAKLSPVLPDIPAMAAVACDHGADGITVVNTIPGFLFDGRSPRLGNGSGGVSGPAILPVGLLATKRVRERLPGVTIIGVGGIRSEGDVRDYLAAGANLVAVGTAALADPRLPERLASGFNSASWQN
ncbi:MAG: dihydroorotate dehydrogenase [Gemmatimonadota bacterium]